MIFQLTGVIRRMSMIRLFCSALFMLLLVSGCGWNDTPTRENDFTSLTSITISAASPTIAMDTSARLTATGNYSGLYTRDITDQVVWSSASPVVADFVSGIPGRVKGIAPGTAILKATVGSVSSTYLVTVSSATIASIVVTPAAPSVAAGLNTQFTATGTFSDSTTQDLTFDATWSSAPGTFATVSNAPASKGIAHAIAVGSETITATFGSAPVSGTVTLNVTPAILQSIVVTPINSSIAGLSKTVTFAAAGTYSDGTIVDVTGSAVWASSLMGIATISAGGTATTVAAGTTSISATLGSISGKTNLTVTALVLNTNGLQITPANPNVGAGSPLQLTLTATFTDGSTQNVAASSTWISGDITKATVNSTGLVTGVAAGSTIITASYGNQSTTTIVTVP